MNTETVWDRYVDARNRFLEEAGQPSDGTPPEAQALEAIQRAIEEVEPSLHGYISHDIKEGTLANDITTWETEIMAYSYEMEDFVGFDDNEEEDIW